MRSILIIAGTLACPLLTACNVSTAKVDAPQKIEYRAASTREVVVESKVAAQPELWQWDATTLKSAGRLVAIQRFGANESLVLDDRGTLHRTTHGGEAWSNVQITIPGSGDNTGLYDITSFYFVNPSTGWTTVTRTPEDVLDTGGFESWILHTTDGGATWEVQYSKLATQFARVVFVNEQEGWVTGGQLVKDETQHYQPLIMRTNNQGNYWGDVSNDLNAYAANGYLTDIYTGEPSKALLVDSNNKFFSTTTGGQNWKVLRKLTKLEPQVSIQKVGVYSGSRVWALGGTDGREGTWTTLAVQEGNNSWTVYKSFDILLNDAVFISDEDVIACGSIKTNDRPLFDGGAAESVILHSSNAGRNWSVVYRNPQVGAINALAVINADNIWAVGDDGLILRLKTSAL